MSGDDYQLSREYRWLHENNNDFPNMRNDGGDDRKKRDRDDDYSYEPSNAILGEIERSFNTKLE